VKCNRVFLLAAAALAACLVVSGCKHSSPDVSQETSASGPVKQYPVKGKVVSTDVARGEVVLDAEAIPGYMDAMAMPYKLKNPTEISELHPGDHLTATLMLTDQSEQLDHIVITAQAKLDYKPPVTYHVLNPGDEVPDFKLLNQNGKEIHLHQFRGKVLLLTFIYTRCPLPDFCPRMSRNFAEIDKHLAQEKELYAKTHLLSVSFDPGYDTPAVLRSYGGGYTGQFTNENFLHWDFAAPSKEELPEVAKFFDVGVTPEQDHTITHSLSTVLIQADGKVAQWYPTNDWTVPQVMADIRKLTDTQ
jgi:protein SCO1